MLLKLFKGSYQRDSIKFLNCSKVFPSYPSHLFSTTYFKQRLQIDLENRIIILISNSSLRFLVGDLIANNLSKIILIYKPKNLLQF
jgi:hypothetical protein